jgi:hypothetical protein
MSLRHVLAAASVLVVSLAVSACSNQAEGERCDRLNNDDDCQEGLVCKPGTELGSNADTCCPPGDGTSDLPECTLGGGAASNGTGTGASSGVTVPAATVTSSSTSTGGDGGGGSSGDGGGGASSQGGGGTSPGAGGAGGT